nr:IS3 family transposase [Caproicibacterium amylolyticum]
MGKLLQFAGIPRSTFYYYLHQSKQPSRYNRVKEEIQRIYTENHGRYGYRRITLALGKAGIAINHKTTLKLMRQMGLFCRVRMKRYNSYKGEVGNIAPNLLERQFTAPAPNCKWITDVTEFKIDGKKLYLSPILDLYNREIVSYSISEHPDFAMISEMLSKAFQKLPDKAENLILHSDQGWLYQIKPYQRILQGKGISQSMSRKATCLDNAVAENFFGILKTELLYLQKFDSMEQFKAALIEYLDYYNNRRIKAKLNGLSPVEYRIQTVQVA